MKNKLSFDAAYSEMEKILTEIQSDDTGLEELSAKLKRATELAEFCKKRLREIEDDIEKINQSQV
jgi:exodeoxyribonuclease VII small subunit